MKNPLKFMAALIGLMLVVASTPSEARKYHKARSGTETATGCVYSDSGRTTCGNPVERMSVHAGVTALDANGNRAGRPSGCPPRLWCGCGLASYFGITGQRWRQLWVARAWAHEGRPASPGCIGCVAVLSRGRGGHVGIVRGWDSHGNPVVYSANHNRAWGEGVYSRSRIIALRQV